MEISVPWGLSQVQVNLDKAIDLTIPLVPNAVGPNCYYAPPFEATPVRTDDFVGSLSEGAPVNFFNMRINPHGNGTHTECVGHIKAGDYFIGRCLSTFHFRAQLISIYPQKKEQGDRVIERSHLKRQWVPDKQAEALIIRTLPNPDEKKSRMYSGTNPPYFSSEAIDYIVENRIKHLLVDLPSIDPEVDGGRLAAHKSFFNFSGPVRTESTLTELIFVPNQIKDGNYLLQLSALRVDLDASPSRVVIYKLKS
jgi:kynurenine formamidase